MKYLSVITLLLLTTSMSGTSADDHSSGKGDPTVLLEPSRQFIEAAVAAADDLSVERRDLLDTAVEQIRRQLELTGESKLTFICTHNSRRSHLSHVWAQTAAAYYRVDGIHCYSGGTEATACNIRTVNALRRAGLSVVCRTPGDNPLYLVQFGDEFEPIPMFSKVYNKGDNPAENYIAMMCCSDVDERCPVVFGSIARIPLHYVDPKSSDNTPAESATYDERCHQIAAEMFYVMRKVAG